MDDRIGSMVPKDIFRGSFSNISVEDLNRGGRVRPRPAIYPKDRVPEMRELNRERSSEPTADPGDEYLHRGLP